MGNTTDTEHSQATPNHSHLLKNGAPAHVLTQSDRQKGARRSAEVKREKAMSHAQRMRERVEKREKALHDALLDKAIEDGNVAAAALLLSYAYGTPARVEPEELDVTMRSEDAPRGTSLGALVAKAKELGIEVPDGARVSNPD